MLPKIEFLDRGSRLQAVAAVVAVAVGTLLAVTASAAAGAVTVSAPVPLVSLEVQSREICPAMPHL